MYVGQAAGTKPWNSVTRINGTDNAIVRFDGTLGEVQNSNVFVDDSGNLGVGTNTPSKALHVKSASTTVAQVESTGTSSFMGLANSAAQSFIGTKNDGSFTIQTSGNSYSDKLEVKADGTVKSLVNGMQLPNVAVADATTLDWYEEGTFTPTIVGTTVAGVGTYSIQQGSYTRVGNTVTARIIVSTTAHTGTGFMRIAGLPFVPVSSNNYIVAGINLTITGQTLVEMTASNSYLLLYALNNGANSALAMDTACVFSLVITYFV